MLVARARRPGDTWLKESIVDEIILKAYADCIVESLTERAGGDRPAAVSLGETRYDKDASGHIFQQSVKFWWETYATALGKWVDRSYETVLQVRVDTGEVSLAHLEEWRLLSPGSAQSAADWIVQLEFES